MLVTSDLLRHFKMRDGRAAHKNTRIALCDMFLRYCILKSFKVHKINDTILCTMLRESKNEYQFCNNGISLLRFVARNTKMDLR